MGMHGELVHTGAKAGVSALFYLNPGTLSSLVCTGALPWLVTEWAYR